LLIPEATRTGYKVAKRIIERDEAEGITRESKFPIRKTIGTKM
jgi:hypothetical protein